jgi:hypothetical protein
MQYQQRTKGLYPLWARQIPYTMTKFATFEETVKVIYRTMGIQFADHDICWMANNSTEDSCNITTQEANTSLRQV